MEKLFIDYLPKLIYLHIEILRRKLIPV